jgi:septal ring factor EnvC (AmiA/AmiB activator)
VKSLILLSLLACTLVYGSSTSTQIKKSKKNLSVMGSAKKKASRKLNKIASDIKQAEAQVHKLDNKLEKLSIEKEKTEKMYQLLKIELDNSEETLAQTNTEIEKKHTIFITLLSEQFSVIFAMKQFNTPTENSIISYEIYNAYKEHNAKELQVLKDEISTLKKSKKSKVRKRNLAKKSIAKFDRTRKTYVKEKAKQKKIMTKLNNDEEKYQAKLQELADKQGSLRNTLAKLNILHTKEVLAARKQAKARKEAMRLEKQRLRKIRKVKILARKKAREAKAAIKLAKTAAAKRAARAKAARAEKEVARVQRKVSISSDRIRKVNSSYNRSKTYKYRGSKTISPLPSGGKLVKKFGTYIDPIYKIKIFNESITLKANSKNAKVQNVLNGKVVFAGKSSMLGKVVVVAHSAKMHTVYAGLSKIAPNIHVGRKIKKGYIVGKVSRKLMFQATKNSKHINPMKLIRI